MAITSDYLVAGVKRRITIPGSQVTFQDPDIRITADNIISSRIVPLIESTNQEFFVTTLQVDVVAGQSEYSIPYRAVGRSLRELKLRDNNNNVRNMPLINLEDAQFYMNSSLTVGFYFKSDKIHLVPDVPNNIMPNLALDIWYRMPPSTLCAVSAACLVTGVNDPDVTVANLPSTYTAGVEIDFIQGKSGNSIYEIDQTITNVAGTTITFGAGVIPDDLTVGDYISLAGTSPVINFIPNEVYRLIESETAYSILNSIGDYEGARSIEKDISIEEKNVLKLLEPRIDGEPKVIINRSSLARGSKYPQRSWLYGS